jgi:hypothetical protein
MIIQLEQYRKARARKTRIDADYDDELLCVNWNPAVAVTPVAVNRTATAVIPDPLDFCVGMDFEEFLAHTYALATQI